VRKKLTVAPYAFAGDVGNFLFVPKIRLGQVEFSRGQWRRLEQLAIEELSQGEAAAMTRSDSV